jgi:hypothetical protein
VLQHINAVLGIIAGDQIVSRKTLKELIMEMTKTKNVVGVRKTRVIGKIPGKGQPRLSWPLHSIQRNILQTRPETESYSSRSFSEINHQDHHLDQSVFSQSTGGNPEHESGNLKPRSNQKKPLPDQDHEATGIPARNENDAKQFAASDFPVQNKAAPRERAIFNGTQIT